MYLTEAERKAVLRAANSYGIAGEAEVLVNDALNAYVLGLADESAYSVGEAAGVKFICDSIWYKEQKLLNAEQARTIIKQARADETYEGPIPEDDGKAVSEAEGLISQAEQAWEQHIRGPEVEAILRLAASALDDSESSSAEEDGGSNGNVSQGNGSESSDLPAGGVESSDGDSDGSSGSDGDSEKGEAGLEENPPPPQEGTPEGDSELPGEGGPAGDAEEDEDLAKVEPWEDYSKDGVKETIEALELAMAEDEDPRGLLAHVWAYESAHRVSKRVLKRLEEFATQLNGEPDEEGTPQEEAPAEPSAEEAPAEDKKEFHPGAEEPGKGDAGEAGSGEAGTEGEQDEGESGSSGLPSDESDRASGNSGGGAGTSEADAKPDSGADEGRDLTYESLLADLEEKIDKERLHVPQELPEERADLPFDLNELSDAKLRSLHQAFSAYAYRATHLLMIQEAYSRRCKEAADELARELLLATAKYDDQGKQKTIPVLEAEVESDEAVVRWRKRQRKHELFAHSLRTERDSYSRVVEVLSRQETMRQNEYERSGGGRRR